MPSSLDKLAQMSINQSDVDNQRSPNIEYKKHANIRTSIIQALNFEEFSEHRTFEYSFYKNLTNIEHAFGDPQ